MATGSARYPGPVIVLLYQLHIMTLKVSCLRIYTSGSHHSMTLANFGKLVSAFLIIGFLNPVKAAAEDSDYQWQENRQTDGITVSTRKVQGSQHKAVRAEMIIPASLNSLVAIARDTSVCNELASLCRESYELESISETEVLVYSYNDIPWPVSDRDAVSRVLWSQNPDDLSILMIASAVESEVAELPRVVRIVDGVTKWFFIPLQNGQVNVVSEAHVDPMGPIPAWLTNILLVSAPLETMRRIIASGRYSNARFDFITEPE
jgi:START domain